MIRVGINGVGRIGRAVARQIFSSFPDIKITAINDINKDNANLAYLFNYDTLYGPLDNKFSARGERLESEDQSFHVYHHDQVDAVPWHEQGVEILIDATGVRKNTLAAGKARENSQLAKVLITHSPDEVDHTLILGASDHEFEVEKHHIIASSICDATALAPVMKVVEESFGIQSGTVTTLHPWLNYQTLMDGPASSWSVPGEIYHHFALGRSAIGNIIPKPTSAVQATLKVLPQIDPKKIGSFSYRTPTSIVSSSDVTLLTKSKISKSDVLSAFKEYAAQQQWPILLNTEEPLVSLDYKGSEYSAIVDHRWTDVIDGHMLRLVLWYDNEWGYARRVVDQLRYVYECQNSSKEGGKKS